MLFGRKGLAVVGWVKQPLNTPHSREKWKRKKEGTFQPGCLVFMVQNWWGKSFSAHPKTNTHGLHKHNDIFCYTRHSHRVICLNSPNFLPFHPCCRPSCVKVFEGLNLRWRHLLPSLCPHAFVSQRWNIIADGQQPNLLMTQGACSICVCVSCQFSRTMVNSFAFNWTSVDYSFSKQQDIYIIRTI